MLAFNRRHVIAATVFLFALITGGLFAEDPFIDSPLLPVSPEVFGQGGSFVANAHGYNALFHNPAGFAGQEGSFTVLSSSAWVYANPYRAFQALGNSGSSTLISFVEDEITTGGFGFGFSEGIGYVGKGVGLGVVLNVDSYLWGPTTLGAVGRMDATLAFIGGLALPINLFGIKINLGADLRPMIRIRVPLDYTVMFDMIDALQNGGNPLEALNTVDSLHGYAFGLDLGAIAELGNFRLGISVRDFLGTRFAYKENQFADIVSSLRSTGGFPAVGTGVDDYVIPMDVSVGASYHLDFGSLSSVIDPVVHASLNDLIGVIRDERSPWTQLHIGTEIGLFRFLKLRGGFNQGYVTLGAGADLSIFELNAAFFTREMGKHIGDRPNAGMTVEVAIRI